MTEAAVAHARIAFTRLAVALREAFAAFAAAARKLVEALDPLIRQFRAWAEVMRRRVMWLDRRRPIPLCIDGHAYRRRCRARTRRRR